MNILYIDRLSFFPMFFLLIKNNNYSHIYYFDIDHITNKIISLCVKIKMIKVVPKEIKYLLGDLRDDKYDNLWLRSNKDILTISKKIREKELKKSDFIHKFGKYFGIKQLMTFFEKSISEDIRDSIVLFHTAVWNNNEKYNKHTITSTTFLLKNSLFYKYLSEYANSLNINTKNYFVFLKFNVKKYINYMRRIIKGKFFVTTKHLKKRRKSNNGKTLERDKAISVSALYTGKSVTFNLKKRSDFFWFLQSSIPRENIIIYFHTIDIPIPHEVTLDKMRKENVQCINLINKTTTSPTNNLLWSSSEISRTERNYFLKVMIKSYFRNLIKIKFIPTFYIINITYFILKYAYWYDFFKSNNIKIDFRSNIFDKEDCAKSVALEKNGGITIACQYTDISSINNRFSVIADVLFLFGSKYKWVIKESNSIINNIIYSGFITDYSFSRVREDAKKIRKSLIDRGGKFIICYFDESSSDDRLSAISNRRCSYIYKRLIKLVLHDETLCLICNSKYPSGPNGLFKRIPEIKKHMESAGRTGRFVFMDGSRNTDNYPSEAAQAADLCIGLLIGGTTVLEAYLSNIPAVFLDLEKLYSFNVYKWGKGKVVFDNIDDLYDAIQKYRENPESIPGFGNLDRWVKDKDPFRDGNASLRVGQYINWIHQRLLEGDTKEKAIEYSNRKFAELWGKENVIKDVGEKS